MGKKSLNARWERKQGLNQPRTKKWKQEKEVKEVKSRDHSGWIIDSVIWDEISTVTDNIWLAADSNQYLQSVVNNPCSEITTTSWGETTDKTSKEISEEWWRQRVDILEMETRNLMLQLEKSQSDRNQYYDRISSLEKRNQEISERSDTIAHERNAVMAENESLKDTIASLKRKMVELESMNMADAGSW